MEEDKNNRYSKAIDGKIELLYAFFWVIPRRLNFYMSTFRKTVLNLHTPAYEDGTDRVFRNVGI